MSSGEKAAARGRTTRMCGIKAVHAQAGRGNFIEDGCFHMGMAVIAGFFPAVIVAHEEDDVGRGSQSE